LCFFKIFSILAKSRRQIQTPKKFRLATFFELLDPDIDQLPAQAMLLGLCQFDAGLRPTQKPSC